jgi:hypothetical protein
MKLWREQPDNWKPKQLSLKDKALLWSALSLFWLFMVFVTYTSPNEPCSSRRFCAVAIPLAANLGVTVNIALAYIYSGFAAVCAFVGFGKYLTHHSSGTPNDAP